MNESADKYLDNLAGKVIKDSPIETPSFNFTDAVMTQVNQLSKRRATVYEPLISKTTWAFILVGFLLVIVYVLFSENQVQSSGWLSRVNFSLLSNYGLKDAFSSFNFSKTVMYAVGLLGIMICIQIPLLKNHFNNRFEM